MLTVEHKAEARFAKHRCDRLVVASGNFCIPDMPTLRGAGSFRGTIEHSSQYQGAAQYRGQRVMVLGASYSGLDLASELAGCEGVRSVTLAARRMPRTVPRVLASGVPYDHVTTR